MTVTVINVHTGEVSFSERPPEPAPQLDLAQELDRYMDRVAKARGYDNRLTCALRAGYPGPFQAEGQAFALWMDNCYVAAAQLRASIPDGEPVTDPSALLGALPVPPWAPL